MQRSTELAKEILEIIISEDNGGGGLYRDEIHSVISERHPDLEPVRSDLVDYHLSLLVSGGLVTLTTNDKGDRNEDNFEMTWVGHDYLDQNQPVKQTGFFG